MLQVLSLDVYVQLATGQHKHWVQKGEDIDGEAAKDNSALSVSLSSDRNTVAIGAPYNHGNSFDLGHVKVYSLKIK